jgi:hypothetical protein
MEAMPTQAVNATSAVVRVIWPMLPFFKKQAKPFVDRSRGDPEVATLRAAAAANDWRTIEAAFRATTDRLRREFLVDLISAGTENLRWVDTWVRERPSDALARLLWGTCATNYAWHVRSGLAPEHVSSDQFRGFFEWLTHAEEQLKAAASMDPDDSAPWIGLLWTAVGLNPPLEEATARWEEVLKRSPRTEHGVIAYTTFVSPRWNGTAELMWAFLRDLLSHETEGSYRWALVPNGHIEQWVAERMEESSAIHTSRYFQQPQVQQEIKNAYARYLGALSRQPTPNEGWYRELFAVTFYLMGDRDALRREMANIGPGIQNLPWAYLGSPVVAYQSARESAGLR